MMNDRPILFSAPMVRALLDGRKSQTRRPLKPQPDVSRLSPPFHSESRGGRRWIFMQRDDFPGYSFAGGDFCVQYAPGDRLWVKEPFSYDTLDVDRDGTLRPWYWADGNMADPDQGSGNFTKPKPSIHMPRWASRLTLTVTDVRVQRLQEISRKDAIAEGLIHKPGVIEPDWWQLPEPFWQGTYLSPMAAYRDLWNTLHTKPGERWEDNPWIVAVSFTTEQRNIDA